MIDSIVELLKNQDELFRKIFEKTVFVGSFYKQTKVGKPEEYDLNLILNLPVIMDKVEVSLNYLFCKFFFVFIVKKPEYKICVFSHRLKIVNRALPELNYRRNVYNQFGQKTSI